MWPLLIPILGDLLKRVLPDPQMAEDAKLKMLDMAQKGDLAELDADLKTALAQIDVNKAEATNQNLFVSGWRPGIGWTCAIALFCYYVPYTIVATVLWAIQVWKTGSLSPRPDLGIADLIGLVMSMLGMAGLRTAERFKGVVPPQK